MNKFAKGSLAAGAGVVLLLGGAGTLAYWNDSAELTGGTVNAGELTLTPVEGSGKWAPEITTWVPGDESTYSQTLQLVATGDNIQGTIALDEKSVVISEDDDNEFKVDFAPAGDLPVGLTYDEESQVISFDGEGTYEIPVEVTVALPYNDKEQNGSQNAKVSFEGATYTATQTPAAGGN